MKKTKIIATVGPVTESEEGLYELYESGVNVIRFNFSHANYENSKKIIDRIKKLNKEGKTNLSMLLDTKGPEIRTGDIEGKNNYEQGDIFKIYIDKDYKLTNKDLYCDYPYILEDLNIRDKIVLDSGLLNVEVLSKNINYLEVKALNKAIIGSRRHVNLPGTRLRLPGITDQDKKDIKFGIEHNFDFIAASFIRNKSNIEEIRKFLNDNGNNTMKIISKVENQEAIDNLDEIIIHSDGVMVARGDLGIEVPIEMLPIYQKDMVSKCKHNGKIVIVATHLLETMIENAFPTRAETSDIFNSVMQKPDALMLSGETAMGKYPIQSVEMMTRVIRQAEKTINYEHKDFENIGLNERDIEKKFLIRSSLHIGEELDAKAILIFTKSGRLARLASLFRPNRKVYAFTNNEGSVNFMNLLFGIDPILHQGWIQNDTKKTLDNAIKYLKEKTILSIGDKVIAVTDILEGKKEIPVMQIIDVE